MSNEQSSPGRQPSTPKRSTPRCRGGGGSCWISTDRRSSRRSPPPTRCARPHAAVAVLGNRQHLGRGERPHPVHQCRGRAQVAPGALSGTGRCNLAVSKGLSRRPIRAEARVVHHNVEPPSRSSAAISRSSRISVSSSTPRKRARWIASTTSSANRISASGSLIALPAKKRTRPSPAASSRLGLE
jgi:hypothetical protein